MGLGGPPWGAQGTGSPRGGRDAGRRVPAAAGPQRAVAGHATPGAGGVALVGTDAGELVALPAAATIDVGGPVTGAPAVDRGRVARPRRGARARLVAPASAPPSSAVRMRRASSARDAARRERLPAGYHWCATSITSREPEPGPASTIARNGSRARTPSPITVRPSNEPASATWRKVV